LAVGRRKQAQAGLSASKIREGKDRFLDPARQVPEADIARRNAFTA
jgi:hypothetical protein